MGLKLGRWPSLTVFENKLLREYMDLRELKVMEE
jgi:hypothetical protein